VPQTFDLLCGNLKRNAPHNVKAVNVAATQNETTVEIVREDKRNTGMDRIQIGSGPKLGRVAGRPLSAILGDDISRVRFIKIDIEGSEAPVLDDIIAHIAEFPQRLTITAEISGNSAKYIEMFRQAGFQVAALPINGVCRKFLRKKRDRKAKRCSQ
jgi:FkbM family methyltransferase